MTTTTTTTVEKPLKDDKQKTFGKLTLIVGPMYSGKTEEIIACSRKITKSSSKIIVIHSFEKQRNEEWQSHGGLKGGMCTFSARLDDVVVDDTIRFIFIDEVQFFVDAPRVIEAWRRRGIHVTASGLDLDSENRPWDVVLTLMSQGPEIIRKQGVCKRCLQVHDEDVPSTHTIRVTDSTGQVEIGGADKYVPVCYWCFLDLKNDKSLCQQLLSAQ